MFYLGYAKIYETEKYVKGEVLKAVCLKILE